MCVCIYIVCVCLLRRVPDLRVRRGGWDLRGTDHSSLSGDRAKTVLYEYVMKLPRGLTGNTSVLADVLCCRDFDFARQNQVRVQLANSAAHAP